MSDKKRYRRIIHLITDILRYPYSDIGKPEPLKYELNGYWSRRIDDEHRCSRFYAPINSTYRYFFKVLIQVIHGGQPA